MQQHDDAPPPNPTTPRNDWFSAQIIEIGIAIQRIHGTYEAYKYLQSRNIDTVTIARTLTQPSNRRLGHYAL